MKNLRRFLLSTMLLFVCVAIQAQKIEASGTVVDANG